MKSLLFVFSFGAIALFATKTYAQQDISITVDVGHRIALDMAQNMPGAAGSEIAQAMAERIGDITYTGTGPDQSNPSIIRPQGTNTGGVIGATVTIAQTGTYTGSFTAGVQGALSGTVSAQVAQTITGTKTFAVSWSSGLNTYFNNRVIVWYTITINGEMRIGSIELPVTQQHLTPTESNPTPPTEEGGGGGGEGNWTGDWVTDIRWWFQWSWDLFDGAADEDVPPGHVDINGAIRVVEWDVDDPSGDADGSPWSWDT